MRRGSYLTSAIYQNRDLPTPRISFRTAPNIPTTLGGNSPVSSKERQLVENKAKLLADGSFDDHVELSGDDSDVFNSPMATPHHSDDTLISSQLSHNKQPHGTVPCANVGDTPNKRPPPKLRPNPGKMESLDNEMVSTAGSSHYYSQCTPSVSTSNVDQWGQIKKQIESDHLMATPKENDMPDNSATRNSCPYTTLELNDHRRDNYQPLLGKGDRGYPALSRTSPSQEYESLDTKNRATSTYQTMSPPEEIPTKTKREQAVTLPPPLPPSHSSQREWLSQCHIQHIYNDALLRRQSMPDNSPMSTAPISIATKPTNTHTSLQPGEIQATPHKPATKQVTQGEECRSTSGVEIVSSSKEYAMLASSYSKDVSCYQHLSSKAVVEQSHEMAGLDDYQQLLGRADQRCTTLPTTSRLQVYESLNATHIATSVYQPTSPREEIPTKTLELNNHRPDNYQPLLGGDRSYPALSTRSPSPVYKSLDTKNMVTSTYQAMSPPEEIPTKTKREEAVPLPPPPLPKRSSQREQPSQCHVQNVYNDPSLRQQPMPDDSPVRTTPITIATKIAPTNTYTLRQPEEIQATPHNPATKQVTQGEQCRLTSGMESVIGSDEYASLASDDTKDVNCYQALSSKAGNRPSYELVGRDDEAVTLSSPLPPKRSKHASLASSYSKDVNCCQPLSSKPGNRPSYELAGRDDEAVTLSSPLPPKRSKHASLACSYSKDVNCCQPLSSKPGNRPSYELAGLDDEAVTLSSPLPPKHSEHASLASSYSKDVNCYQPLSPKAVDEQRYDLVVTSLSDKSVVKTMAENDPEVSDDKDECQRGIQHFRKSAPKDGVCLPSVIQPYTLTKMTSPPLLALSTEASSTVALLRNTTL